MSNKVTLKLKIGCDPEFALALNGKRIEAGLANNLCRYTYNNREYGEMGMDVGMAELRPKPAYDIIQLAKNIKNILVAASKKVGFMQWDTSSNLAAVGGHIHLELPKKFTHTEEYLDEDMDEDFENYEARNRNIQDYTNKIFSFYLPLWLADDFKKTNKTRAQTGEPGQGGYGHYGDARVEKKSSGAYTYELRTPSAQWLTCPKTTLATFAYLATIHNEIIFHPETFRACEDLLIKDPKEFAIIEKSARQEYKLFIDPLMAKIKRTVKKFELYPAFKREINWLFNSETVRKEKEKYNWDVLKGWNIEPKAISLAQLNNKRSIQTKLKSFDNRTFENSWNQLIPFKFNDDANVAVWAHELAKRMYILNWKVERKYIFYGFKKGTIGEAVVADRNLNVYLGKAALNTEEKLGQAKHAIKKMISKFAPQENEYIVGLPYDVRKKDDMKFLTDLVHFMEHELPLDPTTLPKEELKKLMSLKDAKEIVPEKKASKEKPFNIGDIVICNNIRAREAFDGTARFEGLDSRGNFFLHLDSGGTWYYPKAEAKYLSLVKKAPVKVSQAINY